jgi:hypothetical protein
MKKHATCHCLLFSVCTALVITTDVTAAEKAVAQSVDSALVQGESQIQTRAKMNDENATSNNGNIRSENEQNEQNDKAVKTNDKKIEVIIIEGEYIGLESSGVVGSFYLDREFINFTPKTTGDINELVSLLPGVQGSENAIDIDDIREITALPISISGGQPWQTGFFLDGLNFNNVVDPSANERTTNSANDVAGGAQTMNVNTQIVSSVEVFDNNVPAEYGDFSGGVVKANTRSAFENLETTVQLGYRSNQANWGSYHIIRPDDSEGAQRQLDFDDRLPEFKKNNIDFFLSTRITDRHAVIASVNYVDSRFTGISLGEVVEESRENINTLIKYGYRKGWVDHLDVSLVHAPYTSNEYTTDVLNSDFVIDGGSNALLIKASHGFNGFEVNTSLDIAMSENSRTGPAHFYAWQRAKGKDWSQLITTESAGEDALFIAQEGGFGNIENTQLTQSWRVKFNVDSFTWLDATHNISTGWHLQNRVVERLRAQDHFEYTVAKIYSTAPNATPLNCSGYRFDCAERVLSQSLESLAMELGGSIDFRDPGDLQAYSDNILVTPQYFSTRTVKPKEDIKKNLLKISGFATNSLEWENLQLNFGLRYDYDEFYQNHNIAPRISAGYDVFGTGRSSLILGVNRYYSAGQVGDKIREQQRLPFLQFRPIVNGALQGWLDFSVNGEFKYRFEELSTPFDDEAVIGWKQSTKDFGQFSFKWVKRWKRDQLARNSTAPLEDDGFKYIAFNNDGTGRSDRFSFAWSGQFSGHSLWFNASYAQNFISGESAEYTILDTPVDELVFYGDEIVSFDTLSIIRSNFGRPVVGNFGWNYKWAEFLSTGLTARYFGAYDSALQLPFRRTTGDISTAECTACQAISLTLPVYEKVRYDARVTLALNTSWQIKLSGAHSIEVRADISNLLNSRTHRIVKEFGQSGIEVGRQFWLGVKYNYD